MKHLQTLRKDVISTSLIQSTNINDYKDVFCLTKDFDSIFAETMLIWCGLIPKNDYNYWEVFLVKKYSRTVGVCGLYSLFENFTKELWLGWFGIVPEQRSKGVGRHVIYLLIEEARKVGCTKLYSYVEKGGDEQMKFYTKLGFKRICTVGEYIEKNKKAPINKDDFQNMEDDVIFLDLDKIELSIIEI